MSDVDFWASLFGIPPVGFQQQHVQNRTQAEVNLLLERQNQQMRDSRELWQRLTYEQMLNAFVPEKIYAPDAIDVEYEVVTEEKEEEDERKLLGP